MSPAEFLRAALRLLSVAHPSEQPEIAHYEKAISRAEWAWKNSRTNEAVPPALAVNFATHAVPAAPEPAPESGGACTITYSIGRPDPANATAPRRKPTP